MARQGDKERIFPGDTLPVVYETRKPDEEDKRNTNGLPADATSAFIRLLDRQTGEFIEIGGPNITTTEADIDPATGMTADDRGSLVRYTLPSQFTQTPGDYTLLITGVFPDGSILTEDRVFKVLEFR